MKIFFSPLIIFFFYAGTSFLSVLQAAPAPSAHNNYNELDIGLKVFAPFESENYRVQILGDVKIRTESQTRDSAQFLGRSGFYFNHLHFLRDFKIGAFYKLESNQRTHDDWVVDNGNWFWRPTADRYESSAMADLHYKFGGVEELLPNLVVTLRSRLWYNFYHRHNDLILRPELAYFFRKDDGSIHSSVFLEYETWYSLNYGDKAFWQSWLYFGYNYHINQTFQIALSLAWRQQQWQTSQDFSTKDTSFYLVKDNSMVYGLTLLIRL